jgi:sec-independent protein translocase protein TatC
VGQSIKHLHPPTTLYGHIRELQMRLLAVIIVLAVASVIVYAFYVPILTLLSSPLNAPLYYSSPAGGFAFVMKICFTGALIIAIPVLTYNLIMFVRPAFEQYLPKKRIYKTVGLSTILAVAGAIFAFYCILPGTLLFFKGFNVSGLSALISADNYLGFVTNIIIMFVIVFQIPLIIAFIDRIKPLLPRKLLKMEKWVILGSLIVALLAPFTYDLVTSLLIALPIIVLYNLSIVMVVVRHNRAAHRTRGIVHSTVVKPAMLSELTLDDQIVASLADELVNLDKSMPRLVTAPSHTSMDIRRQVVIDPKTIKPADWVLERKLRRAAINSNTHVFSDIIQVPRISHALASQ